MWTWLVFSDTSFVPKPTELPTKIAFSDEARQVYLYSTFQIQW